MIDGGHVLTFEVQDGGEMILKAITEKTGK